MRLAIPEHRVTLPRPLTDKQKADGEEPAYEPRELFTRTIPAKELAQWSADLASIGGPGLLAGVLGENKGQAAMALVKLDGKTAVALLDRLLKHTRITYAKMAIDLSHADGFDEAFTGELMLLFDVVKWVLEVNFESFQRGLRGAKAKAAAKAAAST